MRRGLKDNANATWYRSKATARGVIKEHIAVVESVLGKRLPHGAVIHHIDGNKRNNAHSNLVVLQSPAEHTLIHIRQRIKDAGGDPFADSICGSCRKPKPFSAFNVRRNTPTWPYQGVCKPCHAARELVRSRLNREEINARRRQNYKSSLTVGGGE